MAEQEQNPVPNTGTVKLSKIKLDPARELMAKAASQIPVAPHRQDSSISASAQTTIAPPSGAKKLTLKLRTDNVPQPEPAAAETPVSAPAAPAPAAKLDTTTMRLKVRRQPTAPSAMPAVTPAAPAAAAGTPAGNGAAPSSPSKITSLKLKPVIPASTTAASEAPAQPTPAAPSVTKRPTVAIPAATVADFATSQTVVLSPATATAAAPAAPAVPAAASAKENADDATVKIARPTRSVAVGTPGSLIPNVPSSEQIQEKQAATEAASTAAKTIKLTAAMKPLQTQTATSPVPKVKPVPQPVAPAATPSAETTTGTAAKTIKLTAAMKPQLTQTATSPVPKVKPIPAPSAAPAPAVTPSAETTTGTAAKTIKLTAAMKPQLTQTATSPVPKVKPIPAPPTSALGRDPIAAKTIKLTSAMKPQMTQTATSPVPKVQNVAEQAPVSPSAPTVAEKVPAPHVGASAPTIKLTTPVVEEANKSIPTETIKLTPPTPAHGLEKTETTVTENDSAATAQPQKGLGGLTLKKPSLSKISSLLKKPAAVSPSAQTQVKTTGTAAAGTTPADATVVMKAPVDATVVMKDTDKHVDLKQETAAAATKAEPGVFFLILSIVALLVLCFSVFVLTVQYLNMYEGKNIKVPGWEELSGVKK